MLRRLISVSPSVPIVLVMSPFSVLEAVSALKAGAYACLPYSVDHKELQRVVELTSSGTTCLTGEMADLLRETRSSRDRRHLTQREIDIFRLSRKGLTEKEIAQQLGISFHTVHTHKKNLMRKLCAHSQVELISLPLQDCELAQLGASARRWSSSDAT